MRVRSAVGLLLALVLAGCGDGDAARDQAAARATATPTASPTPTPTPDSGRLTTAEVAALDRADRRVRRTNRAYERALKTCARDPLTTRECIAAEYRPHRRALRQGIAALETAHDASAKQCRPALGEALESARELLRARDAIQRAITQRRYQDAIDGTDRAVDAEIAYEDAIEQAHFTCEDI